jgi:hypothetical protein
MGGGAATGRKGWALLVGARLGFGDAGVGSEDPIQGHAASIRSARAAGRGGHGWRRPWGRRGSPLRSSRGGKKERQGKRDKV